MFNGKFSQVWLLWLGLAALIWLYSGQLANLWSAWLEKEEYSHGLLIPAVIAYVLWERRAALAAVPLRHSWGGVFLLTLSLMLFVAGALANLEAVKNYSLVFAVAAVVLAFGGPRLLREAVFPLLLILLVIPLPQVVSAALTAEMQLLSSRLGVGVIRVFSIPVHLEGNVIDLGSYKLMVVEACSGLRYLFPLISLGVIIAYFYRGAMWQRVLLVVSTVPITILTNSFRIGVTGVLVEYFGTGIAEGFLHDFEGWLVFMFAAALLIAEIKILLLLSASKMSLAGSFGLEVSSSPAVMDGDSQVGRTRAAAPILASLALLVFAGGIFHFGDLGHGALPERKVFSDLPSQLDDWTLRRSLVPISAQEVLQADDYFMGDYRDSAGQSVGVYMAYYASQRGGGEIHSPEVCLPGGGWDVSESSPVVLDVPEKPIDAVRMVIGKLGNQQLLYYWIQQQGKTFANENAARLSMIAGALRSRRTDGALVRMSTSIIDGNEAAAEATLARFIADMNKNLNQFIPD